jgi:LuxR family maltose regulon positive regulatory protein
MPGLAAGAALVEQRLLLSAGDTGLAAEVADRIGRALGDGGEHRVLQAVLQVHRGRVDGVRRSLEPVLAGDLPVHSPATLVDAWLWEARLAARAGDLGRAHAALVRALELSAPRRLLLPFVVAGPELRDLVARDSGRFGRLEHFADQVLAATQPAVGEPLEPLTARELELLTHLPSLLTAEEIAASLYVSVNTVKTHLRGIYRKLGVNSRREAITLARARGLL